MNLGILTVNLFARLATRGSMWQSMCWHPRHGHHFRHIRFLLHSTDTLPWIVVSSCRSITRASPVTHEHFLRYIHPCLKDKQLKVGGQVDYSGSATSWANLAVFVCILFCCSISHPIPINPVSLCIIWANLVVQAPRQLVSLRRLPDDLLIVRCLEEVFLFDKKIHWFWLF